MASSSSRGTHQLSGMGTTSAAFACERYRFRASERAMQGALRKHPERAHGALDGVSQCAGVSRFASRAARCDALAPVQSWPWYMPLVSKANRHV